MLSDFAEKETPCLALKNRIFQSPKNPPDLVKTRVEIMLKLHWREKSG